MNMSKELRVGEWLETWLQLRKAQLRPRTIEQYERLIRLHAAPIARRKLRKIAPEEIQQQLAQLSSAGKARTAEQLYVLLHTAFKQAVILGYIKRSPMEAVMRPSHRSDPHEVWSPEEQRAVLKVLRSDPAQLEILLGLLCGLRRGEICGLMWSDIDLRGGVIHVKRQRQRQADGQLHDVQPKSDAGRREIPIPRALRAPLAARAAIGGYVTQRTPEGLARDLRRVERLAGVQHIGLHGLRHTMATNAVRAGVSLRVVQQLIGHSSFALTARVYTHPDAEMLRAAIDSAAAFVV
jgi:integrase